MSKPSPSLLPLGVFAAVILLAAAGPAQFQRGRSLCGQSARSSPASTWAGTRQSAEACAAYTSTSTCSTSSELVTEASLLNQPIREAARYEIDLGAGVVSSIYGATSSFELFVNGNQVTSQRFSTSRAVSMAPLQAFLYPTAVTQVAFVGFTTVTLAGNVLVETGYDLDLTVRNGINNHVRQEGTATADARGTVSVLMGGATRTVDHDLRFGAGALILDLAASNSLWGGGTIQGTARSLEGAYRLMMKVCARFSLGSFCNVLIDRSGPMRLATLVKS